MPSTSATRTLLEALRPLLSETVFPWGVAYSGGRDSGVLLWGLAQLVAPENLTALHVDHGWRTAQERAEEAALAEAWCRRLGVELLRFPAPPSRAASEAAARRHRFSCFETFTADHPGSPVVLAHHADDQAETVLMRLLKGRSWQGLAGMPLRRGPYRRPLLGLRASVLAQVAAEHSIPFHSDSTNAGTDFDRNFLRQRVFPEVTGRFPRAVEALGDFARAWSLVAPGSGADASWALDDHGGTVETDLWRRWNPLERQAQLLAVAGRICPGARLTRRFLELAASDRVRVEGGGWARTRTADGIRWETVVHRPAREYFVVAEPDREYEAGAYRFLWSASGGAGFLPVEGPDPSLTLIWRSPAPGLRICSHDDPDWGKDKRRRVLGSGDPGRCALLMQSGLLRAALDPGGNRVLWSETQGEKLHKSVIFVKLLQRSDYERR